MSGSRSIGSLIVELAARGAGAYKAAVDQAAAATDQAEKSSKKLGNTLDQQANAANLASAATKVLASAASYAASAFAAWKVVDMVRDSAMAAARFETMGVVMKVAGNNAGYSGQQMQEFSKQLQASGISMMQSRNALTQLATANIDLAQASKLARAAQDLAVVGNVNSSEALGRLIAGIKSGEVEVLKSLGLNVSFEASYKKLATQLGTTSDKLTEQQKLLARTEVSLEGAARYTGIYEESLTTAGKAMGSLTRYWEDFQVKAGEAFLPALATSVFTLTDALKGMNTELERAGQQGLLADVGGLLNGVLKVGLETVAVLGANVAFVFKAIGREIGAMAAQAAAVARGDFAAAFGIGGIGDMVSDDAEKAHAALDAFEKKVLSTGKVAAAATSEMAAWKTRNASAATDPRRLDANAQVQDQAALSAAAKAAAKALKDEADLLARLSGYSADYEEQIQRLTAAKNSGRLALDRYNDEVVRLVKAQPGAVAAEKAAIDAAKLNTEAVDDLFDAQEKLRLANEDQIKTGRTMLEQIEFETRLLGLNAEQRAIATMERELESQGIVKGTQAYDAYIAKLREAMAIRSATAAGVDASKDLADANKKAAEDSSRYWEDALMRAFESGKGFFQSLWDTIKNTLKTQVLRVMVTGVVGGMTGTANAMTGESGGGSLFGTVSGVKNTYDMFTGMSGYGGSFASLLNDGAQLFSGYAQEAGFTEFASSMQSLSGSVLEYAEVIDGAASGISYLSAISSAANGEWGKAAGQAIGTYIFPVIGTLIGGVIGGFIDDIAGGGGGPKTSYGYGYGITNSGPVRVGGGESSPAAIYAKGIEDSWTNLATKLGLASTLSVGAYTSQDPIGDSPTQVQVVAGINGSTVYDRGARLGGIGNIENVGRSPEELAAALQEETVRVLFAALKSSDLTGQYTEYLSTVGDSLAELTAALDTVVLVKEFTEAMSALPFEYLRDMSFSAATGLLQAAGGLSAFATNLSGFYDNFYDETQKTANLTRVVTDALAAQNITLPKVDENLRTWYRQTVENLGAQDLSIAANAQAYASVLALQGSVAQLATEAEAAAQATADAAQKMAEAAARLQADITSAQDDAMSNYMSAQSEYAAIIAQEQESAAQAMQQAADASAQAAEAIRSAMASAGQGITALIRELSTTAGGTLDPMALARSTQAAYLDDLRRAQAGDVDASGRVASSARAYLDASGAVSAGSRQAATVAQVVRELGQLPAVKTYEQQLLEAVQGTTTAVTTSSASNASTIAAALSTKLTAQLNVEASSQILKLINFVANTDNLPDDLKAIALSAGGQFQKTVNFITGSVLTEENKQLALSTASAFVRTFNFVAQSTLSDDAKKQAFAAVTAFDRVINIITGSELSEAFKAQAFNTAQAFNRVINVVAGSTLSEAVQKQAFDAVTNGARVINITATTAAMSEAEKRLVLDALTAGTKNISLAVANDALTADFKAQVISATAYNTKLIGLTSTFATEADRLLIANAGAQVTKLISAAVGYNDPTALAIAMAQTDWITKYVSASGGVLTEDQRKLLSDVIEYDKKVNLSINGNVSASQISSALAALGEFTKTVQLVIDPGSTGGAPSTGGGTTPTTPTAATLSGFFINPINNEAVAYNTAGRHLSLGVGLNGISGVFANSANEIVWWDSSGTHHATGLSASFAQGADYLPSDMIAQVHAGERIIPAADNRELMARLQSPQANSDALASGLRAMAAELAAVRAELAAIKANTQAGAVHQADSADSLRKLKNNGVQVWTDPAEPLTTQVAP